MSASSIFKSKQQNITEEDKVSAMDRLTAKFTQPLILPERSFLTALFVGDNATGKSGTADAYMDLLDDDEKIFFIDLEAGNEENLQYWKEEIDKGRMIYDNPKIWENDPERTERQAYINYDRTISYLRQVAMWLEKYHEELKIRAVVFDGLGVLKNYAEYQMKNEKNMDASGDAKLKYWRVRNIDVLETMELFKILPLDTIFIGNLAFNKAPEDKKAIDRDIDDMMSQKVLFKRVVDAEEGSVSFVARVLKSRQSFEDKEREIIFAKIDRDGGVFEFDGALVFDGLITETKQATKRGVKKAKPVKPKKTRKVKDKPKKEEPKKVPEKELVADDVEPKKKEKSIFE
jgi:hypothetical protein